MAREGSCDEVTFEQRHDEVKAEPCEHMVEGHFRKEKLQMQSPLDGSMFSTFEQQQWSQHD